MELDKLIQEVRAELETIKGAIACLELLRDGASGGEIQAGKTRDPRGRKSMAAEERKAVSARMKRYWASRRKTS